MITIGRYRVPKRWEKNPHRYKYLIAFCREYDDYRRMIQDIKLEYRAALSGAAAVNSSSETTPVEQKVDRIHELEKTTDLIEGSVRQAVRNRPYLYSAVLIAVTQDIPLEYIPTDVSRKTLASYRIHTLTIIEEKLFY